MGSIVTSCLVLTVINLFVCHASNNRDNPIASVMDAGRAAWTLVHMGSFSLLIKHFN